MGPNARRRLTTAAAFLMLTAPPALSQGENGRLNKGTADAVATTAAGAAQFDVLHYALDLSLAMDTEGLDGRMVVTLLLKQPAATVTLNEAALQIDTLLVDNVPRSFTVDTQAETFTAELGGDRREGDTVRVAIVYRREPGVYRPSSRRGYYFFPDTIGLPANLGYTMSEPSDARFWMPCYDQPWDKATAEIHVTVPSGYVAASNGALDSVTVSGGNTTWHWSEEHQIATYLMCVTCSRFTIATLPFVRSQGDTIPLQYYVWADDSAKTASFLPTVRSMVGVYSSLFGAYPFEKYGMTAVVPFSYGGMEHQTITTMNRYVETNEDVVCHELAHQWWGDLVTCGAWTDIWLNESFATYCQALWHEQSGGPGALQPYMANSLRHFQYGSWQGAVYDPQGQGFNLFDDVVYSKGAWVLHMLRGIVGDSTFFRILAAYRDRFAGRSAVTSDFQAVADSVSGTDLDWFFREWIYGGGWPVYRFSYSWSDDRLSCTLEQQQQPSWQTFRMPVTVRAYHHIGGASSFILLDSLRTQSFDLPLPFVPDSVVLDPGGWILCQRTPRADSDAHVTLSFRAHQNYPNPFNPRTRIQYSLPVQSEVRLKIYDILGRAVATLVDKNQPAGEYVVEFDGSKLASGTYIWKLQADGQTVERKMVLVK